MQPRTSRPPRIAIVDGYSTGGALAERLVRSGATCVHVASGAAVPSFAQASFQPELYVKTFDATRDGVGTVTARLGDLQVTHVVPGSESGVELSDILGERLGIPGNVPSLARARRSKDHMAAAATRAGVATPRTTSAVSVAQALAQYQNLGADVVVKPATSAASDNVHFCASATQVEQAAQRILGSRTVYGEQNLSLLVQERVRGREFYVNTVTHERVHHTCEIWEYTKVESHHGSPIYDYEEPVPLDGALGQQLAEFKSPSGHSAPLL